MGGGYGASSASDKYRWLLNSVYAPGSATTDETFLWYSVNHRLTVGTAFLSKQEAFRWLGSYLLSPETATAPSTHISVGLQGIGTGNPGYSATAEKNWELERGLFNAFVGIGYRTNRKIGRLVGGMKYMGSGHWSVGIQNDGLQTDPFVTVSSGNWTTGLYFLDFEKPAYMLSARF